MSDPKIIYEDKNFLAVDKPAGLLVHVTRNVKHKIHTRAAQKIHHSAFRGPEKEFTLADWLVERYPEISQVGDPSMDAGQANLRPGIVHRLDRETSGVMVVARNQDYFEYLKSLFQKHLMKKIYLALVFGEVTPKKGRIEKPIGLKNGTIKRRIESGRMIKEAITDYRLKRVFKITSKKPTDQDTLFSLVEVEPKTGRTHQIRVHLKSIGHPIVGDKLYGPRTQPEWATRLMLHSLSLEFPLREGQRFQVSSEPPAEYSEIIDFLLT